MVLQKEQPAPAADTSKEPAGKKYRFRVRSAQEAVKVIKERLGDTARVLSVRQVNGKGLSRFLSSPQLEVIVVVPEPLEDPSAKQPAQKLEPVVTRTAPGKVAEAFKESAEISPEPQKQPEPIAQATPPSRVPIDSPDDYTKAPAAPKAATEAPSLEGFKDPLSNAERPRTSPPVSSARYTVKDVLSKSGFPNQMLQGFANSPAWEELNHMPLANGLAELCYSMRKQYEALPRVPITNKIAFVGTAGTGKTTALCKYAATQGLVKGKRCQILKVDQDVPNPDDALRVFCDALGAKFHRDLDQVGELKEDELLLIDSPGLTHTESEDWGNLIAALDTHDIQTRVLVVNAAYDEDLLKDSFELGREIRATHVVFAHLDEVANPSKLWPYIMHSKLPVLFFSYGQSIASDFAEDALDYLLSRTFPESLV